ncbi:MAG TPA: HDOD domain-containing protein [Ignavibacteriales bacterium]|nr:HDOD domain-containing protein [Ignavibacteriales bacterium]
MENTNLKLLIVDDEQPILSALKSLLRKENYDIYTVDNPKEAIKLLFTDKFDIVISDMRMPEINGIALLEKAADFNPNSYRIILSGYEDRNIVFGAIASGYAHAYMMKPWEDQFLKDVLSRSAKIVENVVKVDNKILLSKLNSLPTESKFSEYISNIINDEDISIDKLSEMIVKSPAILSKLLHLSNSVYIGSIGRITTAKEAIHFLGINYVVTLLNSFEFINSFYNTLPPIIKFFLDSWLEISSKRAKIVEMIIQSNESSTKNERDLSVIVAMFWDLAILIEACLFPDHFIKILDNNYKVTRENALKKFGDNFYFLGTLLLEIWNFPYIIIEHINNLITSNFISNIEQAVLLSDCIVTNSEIPLNLSSEIKEKLLYWKSKTNFNEAI